MSIKLTARYNPEPEETEDHETGLSEEAFERLNDALMDLGFEDIEFKKEA